MNIRKTDGSVVSVRDSRAALSQATVLGYLDRVSPPESLPYRVLVSLAVTRRTTLKEFTQGENLYFYDADTEMWLFGTVAPRLFFQNQPSLW